MCRSGFGKRKERFGSRGKAFAIFRRSDRACTVRHLARMPTPSGGWTRAVLRQIGELDSIVGKDCMDAVGHDGDEFIKD